MLVFPTKEAEVRFRHHCLCETIAVKSKTASDGNNYSFQTLGHCVGELNEVLDGERFTSNSKGIQ